MTMHFRRSLLGALALGLGLAGPVRAEDDVKPAKSGNWFTRLFVRDQAKAKAATKEEAATPAPISPALARQKALWECMRRQEVCDKLKQIAAQTGDDDLRRKAEILDQRAWDVYLQRTGNAKAPLSSDEQVLEDHLGAAANARPRTPGVATGSAAANLQSRPAPRKD
jgi:hypothetical protein